jgi:hypothetical protein
MGDWQSSLDAFMSEESDAMNTDQRSEIEIFMQDTAMNAFHELEAKLCQHGRTITIRNSGTSAVINVQYNGEEEMVYRLQIRRLPDRELPFAEIRHKERKGLRYVTVERMLRSGDQKYTIADITSEEIIEHFIVHYIKHSKSE